MQIPTPACALFLGSVRAEIGAVGQQETWEDPGTESLPTSPAPPKTTCVPGGEQIPAVLPGKGAVYFWLMSGLQGGLGIRTGGYKVSA